MTDLTNTQQDEINMLIGQLSSPHGMERQRARNKLIKIGAPAVAGLKRAFQEKNESAHFEAAKALSLIGDMKAVKELIAGLEDRRLRVRWVAAEGLVAIGKNGLGALLQALKKQDDSFLLREGAHHVLHDLVHRQLVDEQTCKIISPVLTALDRWDAATLAPIAAHTALQHLEKTVEELPNRLTDRKER